MKTRSKIFRNTINIVIFGVVRFSIFVLREKYEIMLNVKYDVLIEILICGIYFIISFPINCLIDRKKGKCKKSKRKK